jgi:SAM-dependent methyltransferase
MADITVADLELMSAARNYRRWLFSKVAHRLGSRVLEIGAGIGNYTEFLLGAEHVVCLELHAGAIISLRRRFGRHPRVRIYQGDIAEPDCRALAEHACDTAVCFNVLEHIRDQAAALRNISDILIPGGCLLLIVPAVPWVFGTVDRALGHYRRYMPGSLRAALVAAGFAIDSLEWMNFPGIFGWLLNNRLLRKTAESPRQIRFYDRWVVPWTQAVERLIRPPVGLSLVGVARAGRPSKPNPGAIEHQDLGRHFIHWPGADFENGSENCTAG